ncbi:MAG TPA: response regulator, partial [Balneolaceae bacterium]|nr:response regulator [Balneolaceae bacterium]
CIIDDDKIYTFGIKKIIKNHIPENQVLIFENGRQALDALIEKADKNVHLPDVILLDIDMPEMNGWEFLTNFEKIRKKIDQEVQVYVISSRIDKTKNELYKVEWDDQVSDFIRKPVEAEQLVELMEIG